ncbi:MAG: zinc ABC transporter substrate-binding protein [Pseudomonadota bacterium]
MRTRNSLKLGIGFLLASVVTARADVNVVTSIKPVHSLVATVMKGVGEPGIIIQGGGSPHTFAMKPSQAAMLEKANVVFWIGPQIESFLSKPLKAIAAKAKVVELIDTAGLTKLELREGGAFEAHDDHDDHGHAKGKHDDHDKEKKAAHGEKDHHDHHKKKKAGHDDKHDDRHKKKKAGHDDKHDDHHKKEAGGHGHGHEHGEFDAHIWLDPVNGQVLVKHIAKVLSKADPANKSKYEANAAAAVEQLKAVQTEITAELKSFGGKGFIVFHDAYQNFEKRFGLTATGSITVSPEVVPGAKRVRELRAKIKETGVACVFAEPQFEPKLVSTVIEGTSAKSGVLDPLGAGIENGPGLYVKLIRNMAASFKSCFAKAG